ncbi:hypothetical protein [Sphingomonas sp. Leaf20]|jgi:superfamily I DNA and RNA helicase|uniref:hypothetical protein n=1 Tax=Sphingomonas sp. Leaf20 TaxID=1735685 RepID=UPI000AD1D14E|nr:hypothetical protein [Sphingomonas sp. Leaf20]
MTIYHVIVEGEEKTFEYAFDGEPQINLTFEDNGIVYKVTTRAHDENDKFSHTLHAEIV